MNTFPDGKGVKCEWRLFNPLMNSETVLTTFSDGCPEFFFFDSSNEKFYYIEDQKLIAAEKKDLSKKESWALPADSKPPKGGSLFPARIWRDKKTNKIRFAFVDSDSRRIKTALKSRETQHYTVTYKGKTIGETFALGRIGAAVAYEQNGTSWKLIEAQATNAEACDTNGLGILKIDPSASTVSSLLEKSPFTCTGDRDCIKKLSPDIQKMVATQFQESGIYFLNTAKGWAFICPESTESEYSNPGFPAFLYSPRGKNLTPLGEIEKTGTFGFTLSPNREWFSVRTDHPQKMRVYRYDNAKPQKVIDGLVTGEMWIEN